MVLIRTVTRAGDNPAISGVHAVRENHVNDCVAVGFQTFRAEKFAVDRIIVAQITLDANGQPTGAKPVEGL